MCTDCIGSCKSNYHNITTRTAPHKTQAVKQTHSTYFIIIHIAHQRIRFFTTTLLTQFYVRVDILRNQTIQLKHYQSWCQTPINQSQIRFAHFRHQSINHKLDMITLDTNQSITNQICSLQTPINQSQIRFVHFIHQSINHKLDLLTLDTNQLITNQICSLQIPSINHKLDLFTLDTNQSITNQICSLYTLINQSQIRFAHFLDRIISLREKIWARKTNLTSPPFIEGYVLRKVKGNFLCV